MKLKNGWPWSSIQNTGYTVSPEFIEKAMNIFNNTEWENHRRPKDHKSIYPHTRVREWRIESNGIVDEEIKNLTLWGYEFIKNGFPECRLFRSELVYMLPKGEVSWHYDIRKAHYYGTKVMLLLDNDEVDFYFAPWQRDIRNTLSLDGSVFENSKIHARMKVGNFYIFNHRIPHSTINLTDRPRALFMLEFMPKDLVLPDQYSVYLRQEDEFDPLAPPVL